MKMCLQMNIFFVQFFPSYTQLPDDLYMPLSSLDYSSIRHNTMLGL